MDNHIDESLKKSRARRLLLLSSELEKQYYNKFIGEEIEVLSECVRDGYTYGHTSNYISVKIKGEYESNRLINVKLIKLEYPYVVGEVNE